MIRLVVAADIGGTNTKLGLVAPDGTLVRRATVSTPSHGDPAPLVDAIVRAVAPWYEEEAARVTPTLGVSVAGFLDRTRSRMIENANLPLLCDFPLRDALEARLSRRCVLEVDSNAAVLAEYRHGAGRGVDRLLGVTVGTGLGGGVIIDGELLRYTGECAGDIGHVVVDPLGRACTCGTRGCLEAMVCSAALSERAGGRSASNTVAAARDGDRVALGALADTGHWLGLGLASLTPLFAPRMITVGGGVATAGDLLLGPTRHSFERHATPSARKAVRIVGSAFDGWEGVVGAASLAHAADA